MSVEFGGDRMGNLHLFANAVETETYDGTEGEGVVVWDGGSKDIFRKDCRLIYFGPGVHKPKDLPNGEIDVPSNCTVYLAPGALVKAKLPGGQGEECADCGTRDAVSALARRGNHPFAQPYTWKALRWSTPSITPYWAARAVR